LLLLSVIRKFDDKGIVALSEKSLISLLLVQSHVFVQTERDLSLKICYGNR